MSANLAPLLWQRFFTSNGLPLSGGKLYTYIAGSDTPQATYTDETGLVANTNPIVLDSAGECNMWLKAQYYKFVLKDSNDVVLKTVDRVYGLSNGGGSSSAINVISCSPWHAPEVEGALLAEEFGVQVFKFSQGANQKIKKNIPIPESYAGGAISTILSAYSPKYRVEDDAPQYPSFKFKLTATLIKQALGAGNFTNQGQSSVQVLLEGHEIITPDPPTYTVGVPNKVYNLSYTLTSNGKINAVTIATGDQLQLELQREIVDTTVAQFDDLEDTRIYKDIMEITFV